MIQRKLQRLRELLESKQVAEIMEPAPPPLMQGASMKAVVARFLADTPLAVPVAGKHGQILGLIYPHDLYADCVLTLPLLLLRQLDRVRRQHLLGAVEHDPRWAAAIMREPAVCLHPTTSLLTALPLLLTLPYPVLPICDDRGHCTGLLSLRRLLPLFVAGLEEGDTGTRDTAPANQNEPLPSPRPTLLDLLLPFPTAARDNLAASVITLMLRNRLSRLVILDEQRHPRGFIRERDLCASLDDAQRELLWETLALNWPGLHVPKMPSPGYPSPPGNAAFTVAQLQTHPVLVCTDTHSPLLTLAQEAAVKARLIAVCDNSGVFLGIVPLHDLARAVLAPLFSNT